LLFSACTLGSEEPAFVLTDDKYPNEKVVCFVSNNKLNEYGVTGKHYKDVIIALFEAFTDTLITAGVSVNSDKMDSRVANALEAAGLSSDDEAALNDLFKHTRLEHWKLKPDGTYEVKDFVYSKNY